MKISELAAQLNEFAEQAEIDGEDFEVAIRDNDTGKLVEAGCLDVVTVKQSDDFVEGQNVFLLTCY